MNNDQTQSEAIRILITDDHAVVREGLHTLISTEPGMDVIGEAADGAEAVQMAFELEPDVILMDMAMPRMSGLEAIRKIKEQWAEAKLLVLTSFSDDETVFPAIKAGALGYLLKNTSPGRLLSAIRDVHQGKPSMSSDIANKLMGELQRKSNLPPTKDPLTDRELDVLNLVAQGLTNQEIADQLVISEGTVRTHVSNILSKLHLANRTQAALYALREGYTPLNP
ncbi:MAG TPA: response regulator transcription factor [Anaerolineales bacterium]|nr:response regulator transcription factor [Anaerolineales bacterium]